MGKTSWPGRLQWTTYEDKKLLIDGAHNPAAAQVLRDYVDRLKVSNVHWMMGMLSTKDHQKIFKTLLRPGDRLSLVPVAGHSSADVGGVEGDRANHLPPTSSASNFRLTPKNVDFLGEENEIMNTLTILCGSLYLLGEFLQTQVHD